MALRNHSPGYTLVEMLIGMVILLMVIAGALSFFIFQSTEGFESFRLKRVDEAVSLAQSVIARDILEAGFGLSDHPELAVYIVPDPSSPSVTPRHDALYLSYNAYLSMETTSATATSPAADAIKWNTVFFDSVSEYQGFIKLTSTDQFTIRYCPRQEDTANVGGVIAVSSTGATKVGQVLLSDTATKCENETSPLDDASKPIYKKCTFKLASSAPAMAINDTAAPAVCYRTTNVAVGSEQIGALWRNPGGAGTPAGMPFLGGETYFAVTGFEADYQFADGAWAKVWDAALNHTPANLKLVRVRITYRTRGRESRWSPAHVRVITGSPRNIVLGGS